jgi:hypothetical protein
MGSVTIALAVFVGVACWVGLVLFFTRGRGMGMDRFRPRRSIPFPLRLLCAGVLCIGAVLLILGAGHPLVLIFAAAWIVGAVGVFYAVLRRFGGESK